jgi:UDP-N-acetylmuramate--alanine ligase
MNKNLSAEARNIYFLGIGGIGMSALARYFHKQEYTVCGYDKTPSPLTDKLIAEGIEIHFEENISFIPENLSMAVYTPAIPKDNVEYQFLEKSGILFLKRSQLLGLLTKDKTTFAIAGTHGKTSTTATAAHILRKDKMITAFIGGITVNNNSNLIYNKLSDIMLVEADEYDRSFLTFSPDIAVITAVDADHLDIYENKKGLITSFNDFANNIKKGGTLITKKSVLEHIHTDANIRTYSANSELTDYYAANIRIKNGKQYFDAVTPHGIIEKISFSVEGLHNIENAIAAIAIADIADVSHQTIKQQLTSYKGVKRRFEYIVRTKHHIYIDDYAHHPQEIKACIASAKMMHPNKKICGVFQPHLYSRTKDFADEFAKSLEDLDQIILLDIYPARELPIEGVTSEMLLKKINKSEKILVKKEQLILYLETIKPEALITMGAGDIDRLVNDIKKLFDNE